MKTIIEMAREADVYCTTRQPTLDAMLERFAALVRAEAQAEEREACAKVAEQFEPDEKTSYVTYASTAIRARGNT
jgi:hypothetical protein